MECLLVGLSTAKNIGRREEGAGPWVKANQRGRLWSPAVNVVQFWQPCWQLRLRLRCPEVSVLRKAFISCLCHHHSGTPGQSCVQTPSSIVLTSTFTLVRPCLGIRSCSYGHGFQSPSVPLPWLQLARWILSPSVASLCAETRAALTTSHSPLWGGDVWDSVLLVTLFAASSYFIHVV